MKFLHEHFLISIVDIIKAYAVYTCYRTALCNGLLVKNFSIDVSYSILPHVSRNIWYDVSASY